jgi:hypothetical protein
VTPGGGTLIAAPQAHGDPDATDVPATLRVNLPHGTVRVSFVLMCAKSAGCSMRRSAPRPSDKDGSPSALAAYNPVMRLTAVRRRIGDG